MSVRLIAIDIDGTLLDSRGQLPEANRQAICDVVKNGIEVALVTGRSFHHAQPLADHLPSKICFIINNGALVKTAEGLTVLSHPLPRQVAAAVITGTRPFRDGASLIFDRSDGRQLVYERIDWDHPGRQRYYERNRRFLVEVDPLESALTEDPIQVMFNGSVHDMRVLAAEHLERLPQADRFSYTLTEYERRDFSLLDVVTRGCSKGATLAEWVSHRGIEGRDVMAVGDNLNDREMLAFAGVPVVMGNAVPELKATGWPTTGTNDEAGLAEAIQRFVLDIS